jgi:predicted MPP superfamily phosphohydrolase
MHVVILVFLLGTLVGHVALTVCTLNVLYGQGWITRPVLKVARALHDLWATVGTAWLAWFLWNSGVLEAGQWRTLPVLLQVYLGFSAATGWISVPAMLVVRAMRRRPAAQLSNHGNIVDIATELGRRPIGRGPHRLMVHWPFNEQFQLQLLERTYRLPRLPANWDRLSILHISDLHFTGTIGVEYFERVIEHANALDCDLVAVTGDIVDRPWCYEWVPHLLGRLRSRHGAYAILGNHDSWQDHQRIRRDLVAAGLRVLSGRWELIRVKGQPLAIAGTEWPWMGRLPNLAAAPADAFRLLLSHTPDNAPWAARQQFDLMLAGHNHGGQVRLPVIGPVFMPSRYGRRFDQGAFQIGPTLLHVSRGVSGKHPYRFGCMPEITKLVLLSEPASQAAAEMSLAG